MLGLGKAAADGRAASIRRGGRGLPPSPPRSQVGRATRIESFEIFSLPELRAVLRTVFAQLSPDADADGAGGGDDDEDGRPPSLELLKPFKMAHASPRVFWNLARAPEQPADLYSRSHSRLIFI